MQQIPADTQQADWHPLSLDNHPGSRSISNDDICAWCRHLYYRPGEVSLCRLVEVKGSWPASFDPDGYILHRTATDLRCSPLARSRVSPPISTY